VCTVHTSIYWTISLEVAKIFGLRLQISVLRFVIFAVLQYYSEFTYGTEYTTNLTNG